MLLTVLKSKLHRAVVTETDIDYVGSITIDDDLMKASGIREYEQVHVWNITNGSRIITYALSGPAGSGVICLNGAGAHLNRTGDRVIIGSFAVMEESELSHYKPTIVLVRENNTIDKILS
jgi:aspartate 1-decarboxylase